jgi:hypothetical protein
MRPPFASLPSLGIQNPKSDPRDEIIPNQGLRSPPINVTIEVIFHWIFVVVLYISVLLYSVCYSFCSTHKYGSVVSKRSDIHLFFFVHVLDNILVQEVGTRTNRSFVRSVTPSPKQTHGG